MRNFCCQIEREAGKKLREREKKRIAGEKCWEKFESGFKVYTLRIELSITIFPPLSLFHCLRETFSFFSKKSLSSTEVPDTVSASDE